SAPSCNRLVANWIGPHQHGIGSSAFVMGIGIGGAFTPPLIAFVMQRWGWRSSFYISGLLGLLVVLVWQWYVTNSPDENPRVNAEELALIRSARGGRPEGIEQSVSPLWRQMLSNRSVWAIVLGYFCQGF